MEQESRSEGTAPMREPLREARQHISGKSLGIDLPPGYHVLETRFRLVLCFGDTDVRAYQVGTDPKQIERDAARHAARHRRTEAVATTSSAAADPLTGLPRTHAVTDEAAGMAVESDLHVICIRLTGMDSLIEVQGYRTSQAVIRQTAQALKPLLHDRDRFTRHSGDKLLIFTTRSLSEVETLVDQIHQEIAGVAATAGTNGLPKSQIGVASLPREEDASEASALIEALVISAEAASTAFDRDDTQEDALPMNDKVPAKTPPVPSRVDAAGQRPPVAAAATSARPVHPTMPAAKSPLERFGARAAGAIPVADAQVASSTARQQLTEKPLPGITPKPAQASPVSEPRATTPRPREEVPERAPRPGVEPTREAPVGEGVRIIDNARRLILKTVNLDIAGQVATATVHLTLSGRRVTGKAVGRDTEDRRLFLVAEATARAITEFLPRGYGAVLHHVQHAPSEVGVAIWSLVILLTPTGEQSLLGIAPAGGNLSEAAANSVLNALNRRIGILLSESN